VILAREEKEEAGGSREKMGNYKEIYSARAAT